jgi:nucleotide-binding universal stress UspA family protein
MIKRILAATDGSSISTKAVKYAAGLARQTGASITLLGVVDFSQLVAQGAPPSLMPSPGSARMIMETRALIKRATTEYLDAAAAECGKKGVRVRQVIRTGHPVEEILKEARREKADLVVLGSHGRSALKAAVLGSVAFGVIHKDAKIPILVVRR